MGEALVIHPKPGRVAQSSLPLRYPGRRWLVFGVLTAGLIAMAYWAGSTWEGATAGWGAWAWLNDIFGGVAGLLVGSNGGENVPASARLAALLLLVLALAVWRRALLARNAYSPGPVDVQPLQDATGKSVAPPVADLTAQLRKQLSETSLNPPPGVPEPPADSFLDVVGTVDPDPKLLGVSVMRALARLKPKIAYQVRGELQVRGKEPRYGMTVTVVSYALGGCRMTTVWGASWKEAVHSAAYWVMSSLLPVTRPGRLQPWRDWVGRELPPALFEAVQRGDQLHDAHKNDEAMNWYYEALGLDPLNPYLRFKLARVQQECGLYIDALDTMQGSLISDGQRDDDYTWRLWQSFGHLRRPRYLLYLRRRPDAIDVRYSHAMLLRLYDRNDLATQWCKDNRGDHSREAVRQGIRDRLTPLLADRYWPIGLMDMDGGPESGNMQKMDKSHGRDARTKVEDILRNGSCDRVRLFFQRASAQEMIRLASDRWLAFLVPGISSTRTWTDLRICRDLLCPMELSRAEDECHIHPETAALPRFGRRANQQWHSSSPPSLTTGSVEELEKRIWKHLNWPRWPLRMKWPLRTESRQWQDHYNAACVYGAAMRNPWHLRNEKTRRKRDDKLAERAIRELQKALRTSDSAYTTVTTEKNMWLIYGDPDLADLRGDQAFTNFVGSVYPQPKALGEPEPDLVLRQMASYDKRFLADEAHAMEESWHRRGRSWGEDVHSMIGWFREEEDRWETLRSIAQEKAHDWPTRFELIKKVREESAAAAPAAEDVPPGVPSAKDLEDRKNRKDQERLAKNTAVPEELRVMLKALDKYLVEDVPESVQGSSKPVAAKSHEWRTRLLAADSAGVSHLPRRDVEELCMAYAGAWQTLGDWFESPTKHAELSFAEAVEKVPDPPQNLTDPRGLGAPPKFW
jgi:hypothetical protein